VPTHKHPVAPGATIIGLDIGGTKTAVVEGDPATGAALQREELPTRAQVPFAERFSAIAQVIDRVHDAAGRAGRRVRAISVSVGGPLRIGEGVLLDPPHLPGWHGAPLRATLAARYPALPVYVEHDGNAGALAEFHFGVGAARPGLRHLVFLTAGTGLGGGIIANGALLRGASDMAGEFGFFPMTTATGGGGRNATSWDYLASGSGLLRHAQTMFPERWGTEATIRDVVTAAVADDPDALAAVARTGEWLGRGLVLIIAALNPEVIAAGTLGVVLGDRLLGPARAIVAANALPAAARACAIVPAGLGNRIGDTAAIMAAIAAES
jgi:glucokinase